MRKVRCENCGHHIQLNTYVLAKAAADEKTVFGCPECKASQEICYATGGGLVHATIGRLVHFRAAGSLQITRPSSLEAR